MSHNVRYCQLFSRDDCIYIPEKLRMEMHLFLITHIYALHSTKGLIILLDTHTDSDSDSCRNRQ